MDESRDKKLIQRCFFGESSFSILTVDTDVLVLLFYYSAHVNNHFLTLNLPVYVNVLGKSEEHLLNVSNADYDVERFSLCVLQMRKN